MRLLLDDFTQGAKNFQSYAKNWAKYIPKEKISGGFCYRETSSRFLADIRGWKCGFPSFRGTSAERHTAIFWMVIPYPNRAHHLANQGTLSIFSHGRMDQVAIHFGLYGGALFGKWRQSEDLSSLEPKLLWQKLPLGNFHSTNWKLGQFKALLKSSGFLPGKFSTETRIYRELAGTRWF